jgi:hypothetical protein
MSYNSLYICRNEWISVCFNVPSTFSTLETLTDVILMWSTVLWDRIHISFSLFKFICLLTVPLIQLEWRLLRWLYLGCTMETKLRYLNKSNVLQIEVKIATIRNKIMLYFYPLLSRYMLYTITLHWMTAKRIIS